MSKSKMVQDWFRFAQEDLLAAAGLLEMQTKNTWRASAFHSQQAAEKSLKGYLAYKKIHFTKIHDMKILAEKIEPFQPELRDLLLQAIDLAPYASYFRYPDSAPRELEETEIRDALKIAKQVVKKMSELIPFDSMFDV